MQWHSYPALGSRAGAEAAAILSPSALSLSPLLRALPDHALLLFYPQGGPGSAAQILEGKLRHPQTDGFMNINSRAREGHQVSEPSHCSAQPCWDEGPGGPGRYSRVQCHGWWPKAFPLDCCPHLHDPWAWGCRNLMWGLRSSCPPPWDMYPSRS